VAKDASTSSQPWFQSIPSAKEDDLGTDGDSLDESSDSVSGPPSSLDSSSESPSVPRSSSFALGIG
jgi:hypothetical protein